MFGDSQTSSNTLPSPHPPRVRVRTSAASQDSSQFASALLLSSRAGEWDVSIPAGANPDELPYVDGALEDVWALGGWKAFFQGRCISSLFEFCR